MRSCKLVGLTCVTMLAIAAGQAQAEQQITAHITTLEASYIPNQVTMIIDRDLPGCPKGTWLIWGIESPNVTGNPQESVKAVYAAALAAVASGKSVTFSIADDDNKKCLGKHFYINSAQ